MIGPSLILLGLGLGSGEVILWPYLSANFGLGIIWAALAGITIQFVLNMEVERYAVIKGESVFIGFARLYRRLPIWFIISTFIGFGWPGIIAASAKVLAQPLGIKNFELLAIGLLILIGVILTLGPILYKTVETYQKVAISIGIPIIFYLVFKTTTIAETSDLFAGLMGQGNGYQFIPKGLPLFTFLGALAYAGAGGNLNLAQSFYVRDKGYGMGKYGGRITSLITGTAEKVQITGSTFQVNAKNEKLFKKWWRLVNLEHGIVFWGIGFFTISMLALLSYSTTFGQAGNAEGINFILNEGNAITNLVGPTLAVIFFLVAALMLFGTQLTVLDSTSRIMTENYLIARFNRKNVKPPTIYYTVLWLQILFGIAVFLLGFSEPITLIVLGSVINAIAMLVSFVLILILNNTHLAKSLRPGIIRKSVLIAAIIFFTYFSYIAFTEALAKIIS